MNTSKNCNRSRGCVYFFCMRQHALECAGLTALSLLRLLDGADQKQRQAAAIQSASRKLLDHADSNPVAEFVDGY